jgi:hypothetical protein
VTVAIAGNASMIECTDGSRDTDDSQTRISSCVVDCIESDEMRRFCSMDGELVSRSACGRMSELLTAHFRPAAD